MSLSVYVHIPYCLQRCRYCDFTTFEQSEILPPAQYVDQVLREIRNRHALWSRREIATLYFGGGTPSLIAPELIVAIRAELEKVGMRFLPDAEVTIEINPATLDPRKLEIYRQSGINRFSVGAQTFDDSLLKLCGRRHSAADTRQTLELLRGSNYSFDLLFALPGQKLDGIRRDLDEVASFAPPHLSAYCLTVPDNHPMSRGRAPEAEQIKMFEVIEAELYKMSLYKYEISNFARPGFESRHNRAYWSDVPYWGIGLSSHSYDPALGEKGLRFWNPKSLAHYATQVDVPGRSFDEILPADQFESLAPHESLTDFAHMFLRMNHGLSMDALQLKFGARVASLAQIRVDRLAERKLLELNSGRWRLTQAGQMISNQVFEEFTFLRDDLAVPTLTRAKGDSYCAV